MPEVTNVELLARREPSLTFRSAEDLDVHRQLRGKLGGAGIRLEPPK